MDLEQMQEKLNEMNKRWARLNDVYDTLTTSMHSNDDTLFDIYKLKMDYAYDNIGPISQTFYEDIYKAYSNTYYDCGRVKITDKYNESISKIEEISKLLGYYSTLALLNCNDVSESINKSQYDLDKHIMSKIDIIRELHSNYTHYYNLQ